MTEKQGNTMTEGSVVTSKPITKGEYVGSLQSDKYHLPTSPKIKNLLQRVTVNH
jgi:hypothetical protein